MDVFYNFIIIFSKKNDKMIYENNKNHEFKDKVLAPSYIAKNNFLHLIELTSCTEPKTIFLQKSDPKQKLLILNIGIINQLL